MDELTRAGAALRHLPVPAPPAELIEARALGRRRRRGRRLAGGVGVPLAAAAVAVVVATAAHHPPVTRLRAVASPGRAPAVQPVAVAYGGAQVTLPPGWSPADGSCHLDRVVAAGTLPTAPCDSVAVLPGRWVALTAIPPGLDTAGWARSTLAGITVRVAPLDRTLALQPTVYDVPSLGVEVTAMGDASAVLDTLRPSTWSVLAAGTVPQARPAGGRQVRLGGVTLTVPVSWVADGAPWLDCGQALPAVPTVRTGPGHVGDCLPRPETVVARDGIEVGGGDPGAGAAATVLHTAGLEVDLGLPDPGRPLAAVTVIDPRMAGMLVRGGGVLATFRLGLGPDPAVAEAILGSIRPAGP